MGILVIALIVALVVSQSTRRERGKRTVELPGRSADEVRLFDPRDLRLVARARSKPEPPPRAQWEMRRSERGVWEMRSIARDDAPLPLLFPTHRLRPSANVGESARQSDAPLGGPYRRAEKVAWVACEPSDQEALEAGYQRYEDG